MSGCGFLHVVKIGSQPQFIYILLWIDIYIVSSSDYYK